MKKLAFDTETSGIDPKTYKVLTVYMAVLNDDDSIADEIDLKIMPDSGLIPYQQQALDVNGIDLEEHKKEAITYGEAKPMIVDFFKRNSSKKRDLQPCGHNIDFDINFLTSELFTVEEWEKYVHYRKLDTTPLTSFLKEVGMMPEKVGNLESLVEHFGLTKRAAHNAKEDTLMWIDVFKAYKNMFKGMKTGALSATDYDILLIE